MLGDVAGKRSVVVKFEAQNFYFSGIRVMNFVMPDNGYRHAGVKPIRWSDHAEADFVIREINRADAERSAVTLMAFSRKRCCYASSWKKPNWASRDYVV